MSLNEANLEKRFNMVSTSAGSIQSLSSLCLHYKNHHKRIAQIWLRCLQKAKVPHRLTLIYLANDIVQNAKRKNSVSFIEDFKTILKDTIPYLRDDKIRKSVERVFSIWQDRSIYDSKFTSELKNALNNTGRPANNESTKSTTSTTKDPTQAQQHQPSNDLIECLNRLAGIEKNVDNLKSSSDNVVDKLAQGPLSNGDLGDTKVMEDMRLYLTALKSEIEERNRLAKLLEESMLAQKQLLKESESQLSMYRTQFEQIVKLRDELG
uniref:Regulation of nuclear pre-mRNA domain-containing protein 2 n=1 Tax=Aceria tosichella TaxID=561515 RepID=A0A6G1SKB9_9ACAR